MFWACTLALTCHQGLANIVSELSPTDQDRLKKGELVTVYEDSKLEGAPWPICKVYLKMDSTAQEAAAVFHDYAIHHTYVPNITKSEIVNRISKSVVDVSYEINLPMGFGTESYVAEDTLSSYDGGKSFEVDWTVTPTAHIKQSNGRARFEDTEKGSVIAYESFIYPNRWGSSIHWVVEKSKQQVSDTVVAIAKKVGSEKNGNAEVLKNQISALQDALSP